MASSYRPAGSRGPQTQRSQNMVVPVGISACVGHDNWASDVIHSVVSNKGSSSGSTSPESSHSPVFAGYDLSERFVHADPVVQVRQKVRERKRKFHSGRPLELKNLPDNCNEQVGLKPDLFTPTLLYKLQRCLIERLFQVFLFN